MVDINNIDDIGDTGGNKGGVRSNSAGKRNIATFRNSAVHNLNNINIRKFSPPLNPTPLRTNKSVH